MRGCAWGAIRARAGNEQKEARNQRRGAHLVKHVGLDEPFAERLPSNDGGAGVVKHIKAAGRLAAVARGGRAVAVAPGVVWGLLLHVVVVGALARVFVALWGKPRALGLEVQEPGRISGVVEDGAHARVPRVCGGRKSGCGARRVLRAFGGAFFRGGVGWVLVKGRRVLRAFGGAFFRGGVGCQWVLRCV